MNSTTTTTKTWGNFYSGTTAVIIVSVLGLAFIIIYLYNQYKEYNAKLAAMGGKKAATICPDYWDSLGNGKCQNIHLLGSCSKENGANVMDFGGEVFKNNNTGDYAKCKWAKACNVSWSGIDRLC
jgi:hypothetical protein